MNKHTDMELFSMIMQFTNRYDLANKTYNELEGTKWTTSKIVKYLDIFAATSKAYNALENLREYYNYLFNYLNNEK